MGKKYNRYMATLSGELVLDPRWAFEVVGTTVVTYKTRMEGMLWWKRRVYEFSAKDELTPDAKVRVWGRHGSSGNCDVVGEGLNEEYDILWEVDSFAREVEEAIRMLRS